MCLAVFNDSTPLIGSKAVSAYGPAEHPGAADDLGLVGDGIELGLIVRSKIQPKRLLPNLPGCLIGDAQEVLRYAVVELAKAQNRWIS